MTKDDICDVAASHAKIKIASEILSALYGPGTGLKQLEIEDLQAAKRIILRVSESVATRIYNNEIGDNVIRPGGIALCSDGSIQPG